MKVYREMVTTAYLIERSTVACEPPQNAAMLAGEVKAAQTRSGSAGSRRLAISSSPWRSALAVNGPPRHQ